PSIGSGIEGHVNDYFYDFDNDINVEFFRFDISSFNYSYSNYKDLYDKDPPTLNFKTFPDYLLEIAPSDTNIEDITKRSRLDILTQFDIIIDDSVSVLSKQFKNIEKMVWGDLDEEPESQRYKPVNSDWILEDSTYFYPDTLDSIYYRAVMDTLIEGELVFVDSSEWVETITPYYANSWHASVVFEFDRKIIGNDSLMFRVNTDCNDNGEWDEMELILDDSTEGAVWDEDTGQWFLDIGNNIWDPAEPFHDIDGNGEQYGTEPFQDRNCDGEWDDAEEFTDTNGNGIWDDGEPFTDVGNEILDPAEDYTDLNNNGDPDSDELFIIETVPIPNNLLVSYDNYPDLTNPRILIEIVPGDSLITRWGIVYRNLIEEIEFVDPESTAVTDVDSIVTLYTNRIIEHIEESGDIGDYFITKTEWKYLDSATGDSIREYDYLMFKQDEYIYQLIHPSYFEPYGYYWTPGEIEDGFWYEKNAVEDILYYTYGNLIRDGERVVTDTTVETPIATYYIEESYAVDVDNVTVPAKQVRGYVDNGQIICYGDTTLSVSTVDECPAVDTTFSDCFRITREMTMTMVGSGVEYGEKNITWLVRDFGIVKDEVYIRWTEPVWIEDEFWLGYSRWELAEFRDVPSGSSRLMSKLLGKSRIVNLDDLKNIEELNNDPFQVKRTVGLQRVEIPVDQ
ncbi:MAG: hypothetical protein H8E82_01050, partial [Candidatus Marinimicrobia bacterium]|nr:hypothetical protein [Candidatus Neomarinimicrobiota bacterium]